MSEPARSAFFRVDGDLIVGDDAARGPWSADACHAGPVTAAIARAIERRVADKQLVRMTVNFRRPIPMDGFRIAAEVEHEGRSTTSAMASLTAEDGRTCAVASSLHLATNDFGVLPTVTLPQPVFEDASAGGFPVERAVHGLPFFSSGIDVAYPPGESGEPGPTTLWMRTVPIVEGEMPSPFESLCPLADCGNGISRNAEFDAASFVNPDITIVAFRLPTSEWLASKAISFWEPTGIGLSQAQLYDRQGAIGYALQTLLVAPAQK